jgi:hypothetical protein
MSLCHLFLWYWSLPSKAYICSALLNVVLRTRTWSENVHSETLLEKSNSAILVFLFSYSLYIKIFTYNSNSYIVYTGLLLLLLPSSSSSSSSLAKQHLLSLSLPQKIQQDLIRFSLLWISHQEIFHIARSSVLRLTPQLGRPGLRIYVPQW